VNSHPQLGQALITFQKVERSGYVQSLPAVIVIMHHKRIVCDNASHPSTRNTLPIIESEFLSSGALLLFSSVIFIFHCGHGIAMASRENSFWLSNRGVVSL
jgi:hypothetical protein